MSKKINTGPAQKVISGTAAWLLLGVIVVLVGIGFYLSAIPYGQTSLVENTSGWAWSPTFGFTSFNDCYCPDPVTPSCPVRCYSDWGFWPYGINVDFANRRLSGWMWSNSVGAICMGQTCSGYYTPSATSPPSINGNPLTTADALYDENTGAVSGWAKIISWPYDKGWLSLSGWIEDRTNGQTGTYGLTFETSTFQIKGLAWNGFLKASSSPWYTTPPLYDISDGTGYGWFCVGEPTLCPVATAQVFVPYVTTVDGDIYVQGNIQATFTPNTGYYNAMYLIMSTGNVVNFISEEVNKPADVSSYVASSYPTTVGLPQFGHNYFNLFGKLDVPGLSTPANNRYGGYLEVTGPVTISGSWTGEDANNRLIVHGDLYIGDSGNSTTINNGVTDGSAVIIVEGDLHIDNNIFYENAAVSDLRRLASVAVIVEGDMFIDKSVSEIAGNFIVLGAATDPPPTCPANATTLPTQCGAIYTGDADNLALTVNGITMARTYFLQRIYSDVTAVPAEKFVYDGRLLVNPPRGFTDLSKSLPVFGEVLPN